MTQAQGTAVVVALTLLLSTGAGCNLRSAIRASEQRSAAANVRTWHDARKWDECIASAERALAVRLLDPRFAADTVALKARCLMKSDRKIEAWAHYRLLRDFLNGSEVEGAIPSSIERRLTQEFDLETANAAPYNEALLTIDLSGGRYTQAAKWSDVTGMAIVQWTMTKRGEVRNIRVLTDTHPLLAGFAIEAAYSATVELDEVNRDLLPSKRRTQFSFGDTPRSPYLP